MRSQLIILLALLLLVENAKSQVKSSPTAFLQTLKIDITLPTQAENHIIDLVASGDAIDVITSNGVFRYDKDQWSTKLLKTGITSSTLDLNDKIWIASATGIESSKGIKIPNPPLSNDDYVRCMLWEDANTLHIGTSEGLYTWTGTWLKEKILSQAIINDIALDAKGKLWLATLSGLWIKEGDQWIGLDDQLMAVGHEGKYYSLKSVNNAKDIYFSSQWAVGRIADNGDHWVSRGNDGLPFGPVTEIQINGTNKWMGTDKGVLFFDSNKWHYFAGKRWLPDDKVTALLPLGPNKIWIGTQEGISEISREEMTLESKAEYIEKIIEERHTRLGLVNRSKLSTAGDISTSYMDNEDNDGLWTACYLIAQSYRYAVTKSEDARHKATQTYKAMARLESVTGISGLPARSFARASDTVTPSRSPHPKVWHPSPDGVWQWLDDTSSDEITGHVYSLSLYHDLVADRSEKVEVVNHIDRIVTNIIDNEYHLIDFDGLPTRWGIWHPDSLNHAPNWMFERGLNSLQILSFLKTAQHLTKKAKFEEVYQHLVYEHGYLDNARYAKITSPFDISHSDDILNFLPYYNLLTNLPKDDPDREVFATSLNRTWGAVRSDRMPIWNIFASALLEKNCDLDIALEEIQQFPVDLINWKMENSHRWDLRRDLLAHRTLKDQADKALPSPEGNISRWNTNPKLMDVGDGGQTEDSGTYFLVAYWMGRYFGYWE
ncbi:ligand-binding sensor domain-containing protein [Lunatibacter salilacus]|uniref:transcriptional regulator n=1 Tax=Lunatibacter salilacus TaxID=2483804 RepID=UPI00131B7AB6|nr:transcriptional regulator [Lunatibacter salilacus]